MDGPMTFYGCSCLIHVQLSDIRKVHGGGLGGLQGCECSCFLLELRMLRGVCVVRWGVNRSDRLGFPSSTMPLSLTSVLQVTPNDGTQEPYPSRSVLIHQHSTWLKPVCVCVRVRVRVCVCARVRVCACVRPSPTVSLGS